MKNTEKTTLQRRTPLLRIVFLCLFFISFLVNQLIFFIDALMSLFFLSYFLFDVCLSGLFSLFCLYFIFLLLLIVLLLVLFVVFSILFSLVAVADGCCCLFFLFLLFFFVLMLSSFVVDCCLYSSFRFYFCFFELFLSLYLRVFFLIVIILLHIRSDKKGFRPFLSLTCCQVA